MTVYVDDMCDVPLGEFRGMKMSHMVADTDDELHAMADRIGVARKWYQGDHYDVAKSKRSLAIKCGATAIPMRQLARMVYERRKAMAKRPRSPKAKATTPNPATASLLTALKFIEPASREIGTINQTHCAMAGSWSVAFDGIVAIAHPIDSDIVACPNTKRLINALSKCGAETQITQLDDNRLAIKSGKFQAFIPCIAPDLFHILPPDPPQWPIDERVINSLEIVGKIAKENAQRVLFASVLLRYGSAVATDGVTMFEHWHGCEVPPSGVPKTFISELVKIKKKPTHLGRSESSLTIYFEDKSWIRTQVYVDPWPDVDRLLNTKANPWPVPAGLWEALHKIAGLEVSGDVVFATNHVRTGDDTASGAICEIDGTLPDGNRYNLDMLRMFEPYAKQVDWLCDDGRMAVFYGDNFRGVLMSKQRYKPEPKQEDAAYIATIGKNLDDDIPF